MLTDQREAKELRERDESAKKLFGLKILIAQTFTAKIKLSLREYNAIVYIYTNDLIRGGNLFLFMNRYSGKLTGTSFSLQTINDKEFVAVSVLNSFTLYTLRRNCQRIKGP